MSALELLAFCVIGWLVGTALNTLFKAKTEPCPYCSQPAKKGTAHCSNCGNSLRKQIPTPPPPNYAGATRLAGWDDLPPSRPKLVARPMENPDERVQDWLR